MSFINNWSIVREPDDRMADVRISLGSAKTIGAYMVFRGSDSEVIELLEAALIKAKEYLSVDQYEDTRGRPQE